MRSVLLGTTEKPLMVLEQHAIDDIDFSAAETELKRYIEQQADESCTWGYFPGMEEDETEKYPACRALAVKLEELLAKLAQPPQGFRLAFIRMATGKPVSQYGGMHLDVDIGVGHKRDPAVPAAQEIVRVLVNFGEAPRRLRYCIRARDQLAADGIALSAAQYAQLQLPEDLLRTAEIPSRQGNRLSCLIFWSSLLAHEGVTDERGHFMAAYGGWADPSLHRL